MEAEGKRSFPERRPPEHRLPEPQPLGTGRGGKKQPLGQLGPDFGVTGRKQRFLPAGRKVNEAGIVCGNQRQKTGKEKKPETGFCEASSYYNRNPDRFDLSGRGLKSCSSGTNGEGEPAESTSMPETEMEAEITINGVSVHGLTQTQAKEQVMESIGWGMTVVYGEETKELPNLMEGNVDAVIAEAFASGTAKDYALSTEGLEEAVTAQVDELASQWDVQPKNGSISSYDASTDQFVFSDEENGSLIDRDSLKNDILAAMAAADYTAEITASATVVEPEITRDEARENFQRIGTFTTTTTANKDRNENIRLAAAAINGVIVQPGEEFSFNQTTGNRTTEKGYRPAGAYQNGVLVEEPGGGVCQVSSTLYNAVVFSGLKTTERHAHSYEPSYVTPGEDAMVSYDGYSGPDMKFINNSQTAVGLKTSFF